MGSQLLPTVFCDLLMSCDTSLNVTPGLFLKGLNVIFPGFVGKQQF